MLQHYLDARLKLMLVPYCITNGQLKFGHGRGMHSLIVVVVLFFFFLVLLLLLLLSQIYHIYAWAFKPLKALNNKKEEKRLRQCPAVRCYKTVMCWVVTWRQAAMLKLWLVTSGNNMFHTWVTATLKAWSLLRHYQSWINHKRQYTFSALKLLTDNQGHLQILHVQSSDFLMRTMRISACFTFGNVHITRGADKPLTCLLWGQQNSVLSQWHTLQKSAP